MRLCFEHGVGNRFRQQQTGSIVIGIGRGLARLGDQGRKAEYRVPLGGDGTRLRRAGCLGPTGFEVVDQVVI